MTEKITLEVFRYDPERSWTPGFMAYEVPFEKEWMVLDGLNWIKDRVDGSLAYRWSCRMGVCGSCGMMVNGEPKLTCATYLADLMPGPVRVEPLRHFPVMRDLVVNIDDFLAKLASVKPWIVRETETPPAEGEYLQTPEQLADYKQYSMCINCLLCYSACPIVGLEKEFVGPAAIALAQRYNLDNRDQGKRERNEALSRSAGIWSCTLVGDCSVVCPKHVDPAGAIQRYKVSATSEWWYRSLLLPWGRR